MFFWRQAWQIGIQKAISEFQKVSHSKPNFVKKSFICMKIKKII